MSVAPAVFLVGVALAVFLVGVAPAHFLLGVPIPLFLVGVAPSVLFLLTPALIPSFDTFSIALRMVGGVEVGVASSTVSFHF